MRVQLYVFVSPSYPPFAKGDDQFSEFSRSLVFRKSSLERPPPFFKGETEGVHVKMAYLYLWL
jgi:hypothetical protein